jgi:hypothetical protein
LLARGTILNPGLVWRALRPTLTGKARLLPITPELAVTTFVGFSPLVAGLVEAGGPAPFDVLVDEHRGFDLVAGIRATSPGELIVAVSNGADAKFVAEADSTRGIMLLRPKGAPSEATSAVVAGEYLVLGSSAEALRAASVHVATAANPEAPHGEVAEIVATHADLAGPVRALVTKIGGAARRRLEASDEENRVRHGGRSPDFADPQPVIAALDFLTAEVAGVASSSSHLRATARVEPAVSVRVELAPEENGPARDFLKRLPRGDLSLLGGLPSWIDMAFLWHRASTAPSVTDQVTAMFGHRLGAVDKRRIEAWANDLDRGLGRSAVVGSFGEGRGAGAFIVASRGDAAALRRAVLGLVDVLDIAALRKPIEAFAGRLKTQRRESSIVAPPVVRVSVAVTAHGAKSPIEYRVSAAANDSYGAVVVGAGDVDARLLDLIDEHGRNSLGANPVFAAVEKRVRATAACAAALRLRVGARGEEELAVLSVGTDDRILWLDADGSLLAFRAFASFAGAAADQ